MSKKRVLERISDLKRALDRLKESLELDVENDIVVDGVIRRFEFCYELAWKTMKAYIEYVGIIAPKNLREVFREAFAMELVIDGSRARGDYSRTSDIDIAIYADNLSSKDMNLLRYEISELDIIYKMDIVHVKTLEKYGLMQAIEKEGKVIFASSV